MFTRMENRINNVDQKFGHAENGIPLVTSLGLFHDEQKLLASNYEFNLKRKFKSGILSPFSSNMAFVLNKCSKDDNYKVSIFLNELPITHINAGKLACSEKNPNNNKLKLSGSVCDYSDLKAQLNKYIMSEYNEVCNLKQNDKPYPKNEL